MTIYALLFAPLGLGAAQLEYDVAISPGSLHFVPNVLYAGEQVRTYANIQNLGTRDVTGSVGFYQGPSLVAPPHPFSLKAQSVTEDVWIDWTPAEGRYNIMVKIDTAEQDQNPGNNVYLTPMMSIAKRPLPPPPPPAPAPVPASAADQVTSKEQGANNTKTTITLNAAKKIAEKLTPKLPINPPAKTGGRNVQPPVPLAASRSSVPLSSQQEGSAGAPVLAPVPSALQEVKGERVFAPTIPRTPLKDPARKFLLVGIIVAVGALAAGGFFFRKSRA